MTEYTRIPWFNHNGIIETDYAPRGAVICQINEATTKWEANAQRIVDCVNGCAGLNPLAYEEMYKALKAFVAPGHLFSESDYRYKDAIKALTKAEEEK